VVVKGCTQLEVPNAFNPTSANEANKYFRAANYRAMVSLTRFEIFNRWGVKLFSTNDKTSLGWDGKYQGVDQEMGSYTYYIEGKCEDGFTVHKEGNVTLVR
jgi:gliding motility-associated-like protein